MTITEIREKIKELIQPYSGGLEITDESKLVNDLGMDSLDMIETLCNLEREFDIVISDEEAEKIATFEQLAATVERLISHITGTGERIKN